MMAELAQFLQLSPFQLWAMWAAVLLAGVIRGYAGFGFSAIVVAGLSLVMPTREVVPLVILLEIIASVQMFPKVRKDIDWRLVLWVFAGSLLFIPLGQFLLIWIPVDPMRIICALVLLIAVWLTAKGYQFPIPNAAKGWAFVGVIAGLMNGLLAMGGMWVMILLLNTSIKAHVLRACLVALFFLVDGYAAVTAAAQGLMPGFVVWRAVWVLPMLFLGVALGSRQFAGSNERTYRQVVLGVLSALALFLILRVILKG